MANKKFKEGRKVRAKDLFTLFTGLWGHEEFDSCGHQLIKINFGAVLSDYNEGGPDRVRLDAASYGLAKDGEIKHRKMFSTNMNVSPLEFDTGKRPRLRKLYRCMLEQIKNADKKRRSNGRICWNILSFTTIGPSGNICHFERANIGGPKQPFYVPILVKVDKRHTADMSIEEQCDAVGYDFFAGECELEKEEIYRLSCAGI